MYVVMDPITANQEQRLLQDRNRAHLWDLPVRWLGLPIMELDLDLDLDLLYGPNPTDYPRTSANVGA